VISSHMLHSVAYSFSWMKFRNGVVNADSLNSGPFDCHYSENSSFDLTDPSSSGSQPVGDRLIFNLVDLADFRHV